MTYQESLAFLNSFSDYEKKSKTYSASNYDPDRVRRMLKNTGLSCDAVRIVHIAGTKGKGSVASFTARMIQLAGKGRVGLYTSPHLFKINERIKINMEDITDREFAALVTRYAKLLKRSRATWFDSLTFLAMVHFISGRCDTVVLETGLGGRLDSTNFCKPALSVITSVGYDHTAVLGKTLTQIAGEKAGIIKNGSPVLSARQEPDVLKRIQSEARKKHSELFYFPDLVKVRIHKRSRSGSGFDAFVWSGRKEQKWKRIRLNQIGDITVENYMLAFYAVLLLGLPVNASLLRRSSSMTVPYRLSIVRNNLIDVSHNDRSVRSLFDTLIRYVKAKRYHLYITVLSDKEIRRIARVIMEYQNLFYKITVYDFQAVRKSGGKKLYSAIKKLVHADYIADQSLLKPSKGEFNVFTGSFYAVSGILSLIK